METCREKKGQIHRKLKSMQTRAELIGRGNAGRRSELNRYLSSFSPEFKSQSALGSARQLQSFQLADSNDIYTPLPKSQVLDPVLHGDYGTQAFDQFKSTMEKQYNGDKLYLAKLTFCIREMRGMRLDVNTLMNVRDIVENRPFSRGNSLVFIRACKEGNVAVAKKLISSDKYLVHVFDEMNMGGLHWAALRGHGPILDILLMHNSFVDAIDVVSDI